MIQWVPCHGRSDNLLFQLIRIFSIAELPGSEGQAFSCMRVPEGDADGVEAEAFWDRRFCKATMSVPSLFRACGFWAIYAICTVEQVSQDWTA